MSCGCNSILILGSGGVVCGGTSTVSGGRIIYNDFGSGGVVCSGKATISLDSPPDSPDTNVWDGYTAVYPLDDSYNSTADEVIDVTRNQLHGVAGDSGSQCPDLITGVYCLGAQEFVGDDLEFITIPQDNLLSSQSFAVSLWVNPQELYRPRALFTRGNTVDGNLWVFNISTSFLNHVVASIQLDGEVVYDCFSSSQLLLGRWHHIAASWGSNTLQVFVDGELVGSTATTETSTVALGNDGHIARWNEGGFPTAYMQEIRIHPDERNQDWFQAEFDNFCDAEFLEYGSEESPIYS